jgi:hypothetical protein
MLILSPVTQIGVHDEPGVWQVLREEKRINGRYHVIFIAMNDECRMPDLFQRGVTAG